MLAAPNSFTLTFTFTVGHPSWSTTTFCHPGLGPKLEVNNTPPTFPLLDQRDLRSRHKTLRSDSGLGSNTLRYGDSVRTTGLTSRAR